jgi:putative membrane protein
MGSDRRLHPASILFMLGSTAKNFMFPAAATLFASRSGEWGMGVGVTLVVGALSLIATVRVLSIRYRFEEHELVILSGFVFRSVRHLPYARIHNLDAIQNPLHRILKVAEVRIETGGGAEPEAALQVISLAALDEMRRQVLGRRSAAAPSIDVVGSTADHAQSEIILHLAPAELMLSGFIHSKGILVVGAVFSLLYEFDLFESLLPAWLDDLTPLRVLLRQSKLAFTDAGELPAMALAVVGIGFSLFLLALRVLSMFWTAVTLHDYTLMHQADELRAEFGLFTRVSATTPLKRAQALTVQEGPLHRLFGRVSVRLQTVAVSTVEGGERPMRENVAPLLRRTALSAFIDRIFPNTHPGEGAWRPAHRRAFRRAVIVPAAIWTTLSLPAIYLRPSLGIALLACLLAWAVLNARLAVRATGWRTTPDAVFFKSGWILRQMTVVRMERIQAVSLHESPFDRRHQMASVHVDTLGARGAPHLMRIPYVPREEAADLVTELYQRAARVRFSV